MSDRKLNIALHPATGRILQGRALKDGRVLMNQTTDITAQVLHAVIQKTALHGGSFDIHSTGGPSYTLSVVRKDHAVTSIPRCTP